MTLGKDDKGNAEQQTAHVDKHPPTERVPAHGFVLPWWNLWQ